MKQLSEVWIKKSAWRINPPFSVHKKSEKDNILPSPDDYCAILDTVNKGCLTEHKHSLQTGVYDWKPPLRKFC
jgi:hypothetical protein